MHKATKIITVPARVSRVRSVLGGSKTSQSHRHQRAAPGDPAGAASKPVQSPGRSVDNGDAAAAEINFGRTAAMGVFQHPTSNIQH
jgi:hypothetical protein